MWDEIVRELPGFDSAVLTALDDEGYPLSVRCRPEPDPASRTLRVQVGPGVALRPGPAGLLCHRHDELLWNQRAFLARGTLAEEPGGWTFCPTAFVPGAGIGGLRGLINFVIASRRSTSRYLAARGLPRPRIPWRDIIAIKEQVAREERGQRR